MIKIITSAAEFEKLQSKWEELAVGTDSYCIYNQPKLLKIWWDNFCADDSSRPFIFKRGFEIAGEASVIKSLFVIICFEKDEIIGILPLMRVSARPKGEKLFIEYLMFVGDYIFMPTPAITVKKGKDKEVFEEIADFLCTEKNRDVLILAPLIPDSSTANFSDVLYRKINGAKFSAPIREVLFTKHWDKEKIIRKLNRLIDIDDDSNRKNSLSQFIEKIEKLDEPAFSRLCISDFTPQLENLLLTFDEALAETRGILTAIRHDISPSQPFVYQIADLPDNKETFLRSVSEPLRRKYKHFADKEKNEVDFSFQNKLTDDEYGEFIGLHRKNFPNSLHFSNFTANYYRVLLKQLEKDSNLMWLIGREKNGTPVSFILLYVFGNVMSYIVAARDASFDKLNLGSVGLLVSMLKSIELGYTKFDFRIGNEMYKSGFGTKKHLLCALLVSKTEKDLSKLISKQWLIKY